MTRRPIAYAALLLILAFFGAVLYFFVKGMVDVLREALS